MPSTPATLGRLKILVCAQNEWYTQPIPCAVDGGPDTVTTLSRLRRVLDRLRVGKHNATDMSLDDPRDRERVPGRLKHHLIIPGETLPEQLERRRRRLDPPRMAHPTTLGDCDLAEVAVHIQRDEAHAYLLSLNQSAEKRWAKRQLRIRARGTPGQSQGRPTTNDGLAAHSVSDGLPNLVSP